MRMRSSAASLCLVVLGVSLQSCGRSRSNPTPTSHNSETSSHNADWTKMPMVRWTADSTEGRVSSTLAYGKHVAALVSGELVVHHQDNGQTLWRTEVEASELHAVGNTLIADGFPLQLYAFVANSPTPIWTFDPKFTAISERARSIGPYRLRVLKDTIVLAFQRTVYCLSNQGEVIAEHALPSSVVDMTPSRDSVLLVTKDGEVLRLAPPRCEPTRLSAIELSTSDRLLACHVTEDHVLSVIPQARTPMLAVHETLSGKRKWIQPYLVDGEELIGWGDSKVLSIQGIIVVCGAQRGVEAFDVETGETLWRLDYHRDFYAPTHLLSNGTTVLACFDKDDVAYIEKFSRVPVFDSRIVAVNPQTGRVLWTTTLKGRLVACPAVSSARMYALPSHSGKLTALEFAN